MARLSTGRKWGLVARFAVERDGLRAEWGGWRWLGELSHLTGQMDLLTDPNLVGGEEPDSGKAGAECV